MDNNKILNISDDSLQDLTIEQIADLKLEITDLLSKIDLVLNDEKNN